jgi:hypothetical protein
MRRGTRSRRHQPDAAVVGCSSLTMLLTREPIEPGEKGRGFEVGKNHYLLIEDDELDAVTIESNHTIEIDSFVPREQMDERYLDSPYYLVPNDSVGQEAFGRARSRAHGSRQCRCDMSRMGAIDHLVRGRTARCRVSAASPYAS